MWFIQWSPVIINRVWMELSLYIVKNALYIISKATAKAKALTYLIIHFLVESWEDYPTYCKNTELNIIKNCSNYCLFPYPDNMISLDAYRISIGNFDRARQYDLRSLYSTSKFGSTSRVTRNGRPRSPSILALVLLTCIILIQAGDVETNPGPVTIK